MWAVQKIRESFPKAMTLKSSFKGLITIKQVDKIVGEETPSRENSI